MIRLAVLLMVLLLTACQTSGQKSDLSEFDLTYAKFDAQPVNDQTKSYLSIWGDFNNSNQLDERDGCYFKSEGETQQILVLDASGTVTEFLADKDNDRTRCFRAAYLGVEFPAPPFAPYYVHMVMR